MKQRFVAWGYPSACIEEAYSTALSTFRADLLKKSVKRDKKFSVSCITTYSPSAHMIKNTVKKYWPLIKDDPSLQDKFKEPPLFVFTRALISVIR